MEEPFRIIRFKSENACGDLRHSGIALAGMRIRYFFEGFDMIGLFLQNCV